MGLGLERAVAIALLVLGTAYLVVARDPNGRATAATPQADAAYYYAYAPSLVLDRDLDFTNQYRVTGNWYHLGTAPTGVPSNVFGIGPAVLSLPVFVAAHGVALAVTDRSDGFSEVETAAVLWTSWLATVLAIVVAGKLARRHVPERGAAIAGAVLAAFAGPVAYYALRQPGYAHPFATLFTTLLVERWDASFAGDAPRSARTWLVLGAALGAAALARPQLALWAVILAPCAIDDVRKRGAVSAAALLGRWAAGALVALGVFAPQLLAWKAIYGAYYVVPQGPGFMRWDAPCVVDVLFSSRNGLFPWAPLYLVLLAAPLALRPRLRLGGTLAAAFLLQALANGAAWDWWAGGSFGGRRFDSVYPIAALGGAVVCGALWRGVARGPTWRRALTGAAAALVLVCVLAETLLMHRTSAVDANIGGGTAASAMWRRKVGALGAVPALLASAETAPAAVAYTLRTGAPLAAYGRLGGVHALGETYPGLNSYPDKVRDTIAFGDLSSPRFAGLRLVRPRRAECAGGRATIVVGLNRRGHVRVTAELQAQSAAVTWNGAAVWSTPAGGAAAPSTIDFTTDDLRRGPNVLEITSDARFELGEPTLTASP